MEWTNVHDVILCREILTVQPFKARKGTNERGKLWTEIAETLKRVENPKFKASLNQRSVRERFSIIQTRFKQKERTEIAASGITTEQDELDILLEDITEREKAFEENRESLNATIKADKQTADDIRRRAMERIGETKKREVESSGVKKRRRSANDAVSYLREKSEKETKFREMEIQLRKEDQNLQSIRHDDFVKQQQNTTKMLEQQCLQQQQQMQSLQVMFMQQQQQQNQIFLAILEKLTPK